MIKNWNMMTNEMQKSLHSMMELNARTLQNFRYLKPEDLTGVKQPTDLLGKQMALAMENNQQLLDYMHKSFQIMENVFLSFSKDMHEKSEQSFKQAKTMSEVMHHLEVKPAKVKKSAAKSKMASSDKKNKVTKASSTAKKAKSTMTSSTDKKAKSAMTSSTKKTVKASKTTKTQVKKADAKKTTSPKMKASSISLKSSKPAKNETKMGKAKSSKTTSKNKITVLEKKMGMPEPKSNLLVNSMINDKKISMPESKMDRIDQPLSGHPMTEQAGKGKNPFQK